MIYRKDIDGLRAIAVMVVIFNHLGFYIFSGGFIGVDVFFVISGYLITQSIQEDISNNKFTIYNFYIKRIRRIIPALFFIVLFTTIISLFILPIYQLKEYALSVISVATFTSNIFFWIYTDYFSVASELKPLLHTWSLGVEEQFYILFPIVMLFTQHILRRKLIYLIVLFLLISFILSASSLGINNSSANFFLPITRFWELLSGSVLALTIQYIYKEKTFFNNILSIVGLFCILLPVFLLDKHSIFPGINALYPVIGSIFILYTGYRQSTYLSSLLSVPFIRYIGLISYSLYLWHWSIIALANNFMLGTFTFLNQLSIFSLSFILAALTYQYIEQPFRNNPKLKYFLQLKTGGLALLILITIASLIVLFVNTTYDKKKLINIKSPSSRCFKSYETLESTQRCSFGDKTSDKIFLLYGDSHAEAMTPVFDRIANEKHWRGIKVDIAGCPPLFDVFRLDGLGNSMNCTGVYAKNIEIFLEENKNKIEKVFLVSRWTLYEEGWIINGRLQAETHFLSNKETKSKTAKESAKVLKKALLHTIDKISRRLAIETIIFAPIPVLLGDIRNPKTKNLTKNEYKEQRYFIDNIFKLFNQNNLVKILDPIDIICPDKICLMYKNTQALYRDDNHISSQGSQLFHSLIETELPTNQDSMMKIKTINYEKLQSSIREGTPWNAKLNYILTYAGLKINLKTPQNIKVLFIGLDCNDKYKLVLKLKNKIIKIIELKEKVIQGGGISTREVILNKRTLVDTIEIYPLQGDNYYSLGYLKYE